LEKKKTPVRIPGLLMYMRKEKLKYYLGFLTGALEAEGGL
jgi:hypothetical protein